MCSKFIEDCSCCGDQTVFAERPLIHHTDAAGEKITISECVSDIRGKFCSLDSQAFTEAQEILSEALCYLQTESCKLLSDLNNYSIWIYTHSIDVALISLIVANKLRYKREDMKNLCLGALLHDIGKLLIPEKILQKPARLNHQEMAVIQQHSVLGYNMITALNIHPDCKKIVLQHHERMDGSGYPFGLCDESISDHSKIVMAADALDAMTSYRPYKSARTMETAIGNLKQDGAKYSGKILLVLEGLAR